MTKSKFKELVLMALLKEIYKSQPPLTMEWRLSPAMHSPEMPRHRVFEEFKTNCFHGKLLVDFFDNLV